MNAFILALCVAVSQAPSDLSATARQRIEQARPAIVEVKAANDSGETIFQGLGFFIRKDLIATDGEVVDRNSHLRISVATKSGTLRVISSGNYILPYVLLESQPEVSPLTLADSERVAINDSVYMFGDLGEILTGKVTRNTTINNTRAFLITLAINAGNKGAPIFNRYGE